MSDNGGYHLLKKIAAGGMAEVFLARATSDESLVVVKRMLPQFSQLADYVEMFFDEGRVVSLLRHPNIVRMREFGFQQDLPFLAMEFLDGLDLHQLLKLLRQRHQRLPLAIALYIAACMGAGLHHTHEALSIDGRPMGIIHRDVSPHNVVLTAMGEVKLIDFGIAKSMEREHATRGGTLKGKVRYMSPEQLRGLDLDRRSDIYAMGVLLYELTVGRSPYFDATTKGEPVGEFGLMMAVTSQSIAPPTGVALPLVQVIQKAMATSPAQRYQTCAELILDLEAVAVGLGLKLHAAPLMQLMNEVLQYRAQTASSQRAADTTVLADEWYEVAATDDCADASVDQRDEATVGAAVYAQLDTPTIARPSEMANLLASMQRAAGQVAPPSRSPHLLAQPVVQSVVQSAVQPFTQATAQPNALSLAADQLSGHTTLHVIALAGRVTAALEQIANATTMEGRLLFDFGRVEKFPQECVRAWFDFHEAMANRREPVTVFFGSCGPALVKQAARARTILGDAHIVSLALPCQCLTCGEAFEHVVDCEHDMAVLHGELVTSVLCPFCGGLANCDDDSSFRVASSRFWGLPVPAPVRAALAGVVAQRRNLETIEKTVEGQHTQIRVRSANDGQLRWARIFDGLEGEVTLDLALARLDDVAIAGFRRALPTLADQASAVTLCGVPPELLRAAELPIANVQIESVACRCFCSGCAAWRLCVVSAADWQHMLTTGGLALACPGCRLELRPVVHPAQAPSDDAMLTGAPPWRSEAQKKRQRASWFWPVVAIVAVVAALLIWLVLT